MCLLSEEIAVGNDFLDCRSASLARLVDALESFEESGGRSLVRCGILDCVKPCLAKLNDLFILAVFGNDVDLLGESLRDRFLSEEHSKTEFGVVLKERVCPCRTLALLVYGVRSARRASAPY